MTLRLVAKRGISWILAVFVNTLLNLMDAATYGRLFFPVQTPLFMDFDVLGVCMYLMSTSVSQLIISLGSSFKKGATACAMVENIPFYHSISLNIATRLTDRDSIVSTILASYMASAILTGSIFMILALLEFDKIVHKFPRTVLVGSMGGIGLYLIATGLEMASSEAPFKIGHIGKLFSSWITFGLWSIGFGAALMAILLEVKWHVPFVTPIISLGLLIGFYLIYPLQSYSIEKLYELGWLLGGPARMMNPIDVFNQLSWNRINWLALAKVLPIVFGAAFFGSLHVPINIPSYARISRQTFSMKRELWTLTISNFVTSIIGFVPNYFVYTNSTLFLRAGGDHQIAGIFLAISTGILLFHGLELLSYVPTVIPLFLVFYLGTSLIWEALICSYVLCSSLEYFMIVTTVLGMQSFGFLPGIVLGILLVSVYTFLVYRLVPEERSNIFEPEASEIASPAIERTVRKLLEKSLIDKFEGFLYFGNCIEELQKLTFTTIDSKLIFIDFSNVSAMDLNFREGFLAFLASPLLKDHQVICLNLQDASLIKVIKQDHLYTFIGNGLASSWIRDQLCYKSTLDDSDNEMTTLIMGEEGESEGGKRECMKLSEIDRIELENDQKALNTIIQSLSTVRIELQRGESLKDKIPNADGALIIVKGKMRKRVTRYTNGAWIGLKEIFEERDGLNDCLAIGKTSALYVSKSAIQSMSTKDLKLLKHMVLP